MNRSKLVGDLEAAAKTQPKQTLRENNMAFDQSIAELDRIIAFVQSNVTATSTTNTPQQQAPKKKQPQPKKEQKPAAPKKSANPDIAVFQNAHIQVVRIHSVAKHPQADSMFVLKADLGNGQDRTVVAGLFKYYKAEELEGKLVCSIINLKPAKLRGIESSAMLLAGSHGESVKLLSPPEGSEPGDRVYLRGEEAEITDAPDKCPPKQWEKIVSLLKTNNGKPKYASWDLVTSKGDIVCDLPDNSEIH